MAVELTPSIIALLVYASIYFILVLVIGGWVWWSRKNNPKIALKDRERTYFEELYNKREIYAAAIVHLYDQATDIAVMINWARLTSIEVFSDENLDNINMLTLFIPGLAFMIAYRLITILFVLYEGSNIYKPDYYEIQNQYLGKSNQTNANAQKNKLCSKIWDVILATFDLYFIKVIYLEFSAGEVKPSKTHRSLQLCESLFESFPQVVLQSVFLLRFGSIDSSQTSVSIGIVIVSLTASILSIANKYAWFDEQAVVYNAKELRMDFGSGKCCTSSCFSWRFLLRSLWRWSDLFSRFIIFSLLWVCIGGLYLGIYCALSFCLYYFIISDRIKGNFWYRLLATQICIVGIILDYEWHFCIIRLIDNGIMIIIIQCFVFLTFDCSDYGCSENSVRSSDIPIIFTFTVLGLCVYIIELISYPILQTRAVGIIKKALKGREFFSIILFGEDTEIPSYYLSYYIDSKSKTSDQRLTYNEIVSFTGKKSADDCNQLEEDILDVFRKSNDLVLNLSAGDILIEHKHSKVFKYGISIKILQSAFGQDKQPLFGVAGVKFIEDLYNNRDNNIFNNVQDVFRKHFAVEKDRENKFKLRFTRKESLFMVLNANINPIENNKEIVTKYRFGQELRRYNDECRIIYGYNYDALHDTNKQVLIKVIDKLDHKTKSFSRKNYDLFNRETMNLKILNNLNKNKVVGILPFIGDDDADDAYFIVTKRLLGIRLLDKITENNGNNCTQKQLMIYIRNMFEIVQYLHSHHITHRNINTDSFKFDGNDNLILTHYEYSKQVQDNDNKLYGNINGKILYLSPELCAEIKLRNQTKIYNKNSISGNMYKESDIWALGITTYFLITGKNLFYIHGVTHSKFKKILNNIINFDTFKLDDNEEPFKYSESNKLFVDFLNKIFNNNYLNRISISQCLNHGFLSVDQHINNLDDNTFINKSILGILNGNEIKSKLHEAISNVRVEQIIQNERKQDNKQEEKDDNDVVIRHTTTEFNKILENENFNKMKEQFKRIDIDGDGYTTIDELTTLLVSLGYAINFAKKEANIIMNTLDIDGDGTIDFNEFATAWVSRKLTTNDKYIHSIFNVFDENGDGYITIDELQNGLFPKYNKKNNDNNDDNKDNFDDDKDDKDDKDDMKNDWHEDWVQEIAQFEQLEAIIEEIDKDNDAKLSFNEFHSAMINDLNKNENQNKVPFTQILHDIQFKYINKNNDNPLFENHCDYENYDNKNNNNNNNNNPSDVNIAMEMQSNMK